MKNNKNNKNNKNKYCIAVLGSSKRTLTCVRRLLKEWNVVTTTVGLFNPRGKTIVRLSNERH